MEDGLAVKQRGALTQPSHQNTLLKQNRCPWQKGQCLMTGKGVGKKYMFIGLVFLKGALVPCTY